MSKIGPEPVSQRVSAIQRTWPTRPTTNQPTPDRPTPREPVPIGLFLAPPHHDRPTPFARPGVPDWHGLPPRNVAHPIAHYTRFGDVVLDLDAHPTIAAAARYLRRAPARLITHAGHTRVRLTAPPPGQDRPRRVVCSPGPGANLVVVTLPRPEPTISTCTQRPAPWAGSST
jgi:hypothetical protein